MAEVFLNLPQMHFKLTQVVGHHKPAIKRLARSEGKRKHKQLPERAWDHKKITKIVFHAFLCEFQSVNLVLAIGVLPLDPALYCDRERAWGAAPRTH